MLFNRAASISLNIIFASRLSIYLFCHFHSFGCGRHLPVGCQGNRRFILLQSLHIVCLSRQSVNASSFSPVEKFDFCSIAFFSTLQLLNLILQKTIFSHSGISCVVCCVIVYFKGQKHLLWRLHYVF